HVLRARPGRGRLPGVPRPAARNRLRRLGGGGAGHVSGSLRRAAAHCQTRPAVPARDWDRVAPDPVAGHSVLRLFDAKARKERKRESLFPRTECPWISRTATGRQAMLTPEQLLHAETFGFVL